MHSLLNKRLRLFGPALIAIVFLLLPFSSAFADTIGQPTSNTIGQPSANTVGQPTANTIGNSSNTLQNPLGVCSISDLIALLLKAAIAIGIPIAVLFIVWAGFKFILARGSPGELSEARANLIAVVIGIAIFVGASLIANVIISTLHQLGVQDINTIGASSTSSCQ
jgi:hypothetical protein